MFDKGGRKLSQVGKLGNEVMKLMALLARKKLIQL